MIWVKQLKSVLVALEKSKESLGLILKKSRNVTEPAAYLEGEQGITDDNSIKRSEDENAK
ncbi:hypothetical protein TSAR_001407 [Trichomalopsis sarcophagae]|uniref:Uncharacterized protein n=1 Tax=Trichomalopsis sarcophagae TaxID=543379 RepID=A0A232F9L3_9HYME|nr:hypothetical protein TSAR_001407 [Trichomalopsis sarcophagae]